LGFRQHDAGFPAIAVARFRTRYVRQQRDRLFMMDALLCEDGIQALMAKLPKWIEDAG
jgi:hypothetical protein